ncbi:uncharacterized protein LOC143899324 [Temnothorax americanus]|uniref:uncharacterized protein LOC143899324 n=1 Tax=Temnothorax americanus TaxID=1964332 RepID=UPI004069806B
MMDAEKEANAVCLEEMVQALGSGLERAKELAEERRKEIDRLNACIKMMEEKQNEEDGMAGSTSMEVDPEPVVEGREVSTQTPPFSLPLKETRGVAIQAYPRVKDRGTDAPVKGAFGDRGPEGGEDPRLVALDNKVEALAREIRSLAKDMRGASLDMGGKPSEVRMVPAGSSSSPARRPGGGSRAGGVVGGGVAAPVPSLAGRDSRGSGAGGASRVLPPIGRKRRAKAAVPAPPKTAAVTITVPGGSPASYAEVLRTARERVSLADLGVAGLSCRRAITGGLVIEVPGDEQGEKADLLARQVSAALEGSGVRVSRPSRCVGLRLVGLDDSITPAEIRAAVTAGGGCREGDVTIGEIVRRPLGMGATWVRCPVGAANIILKRGLKVGWSSPKIGLLRARPLRCYRCLGVGHVGALCTSPVDRSGLCYRCGVSGHRARECPAAAPRCPLCADSGLPAGHLMGGAGCAHQGGGKGGRGPPTTVVPPPPSPSGQVSTCLEVEMAGDESASRGHSSSAVSK